MLGAIIDFGDDLTDEERAEIEERLTELFPDVRLVTCERIGWVSTDHEVAAPTRLHVIRE